MQRTLEVPGAVDQVLALVAAELDVAQVRFAPFHSPHEGYAVLLGEVDELWEEICRRHVDPQRVCAEAVQVAAMGVRFMLDIRFGDTTRGQALTLVRSELAMDIALRPYTTVRKTGAGITEHLERLWSAVRANLATRAKLHAVPVAALAARLLIDEGARDGAPA